MRGSYTKKNVWGGTAALAMHADRLVKPNRPTEVKHTSDRRELKETQKKEMIAEIGIEEYMRREQEAAERKFTVMPMHKSNYVVVADPEIVKMMGKKVV